nr:hypothetical protein BaRGS_006082 [Batillaria attramentaria]
MMMEMRMMTYRRLTVPGTRWGPHHSGDRCLVPYLPEYRTNDSYKEDPDDPNGNDGMDTSNRSSTEDESEDDEDESDSFDPEEIEQARRAARQERTADDTVPQNLRPDDTPTEPSLSDFGGSLMPSPRQV